MTLSSIMSRDVIRVLGVNLSRSLAYSPAVSVLSDRVGLIRLDLYLCLRELLPHPCRLGKRDLKIRCLRYFDPLSSYKP